MWRQGQEPSFDETPPATTARFGTAGQEQSQLLPARRQEVSLLSAKTAYPEPRCLPHKHDKLRPYPGSASSIRALTTRMQRAKVPSSVQNPEPTPCVYANRK